MKACIHRSTVFIASLFGMSLVQADTIYVANWTANTIEKFDSTGHGSVFATTGVNGPTGLAYYGGYLYVANEGNNTIWKFDSSGNGSLFANTGILSPSGLAFDKSGNLYVANDASANTIVKFDPSGHGSVFASGLNSPAGLAFDTNGNLYVADYYNLAIKKFDPSGHGTIFASNLLVQPFGIVFDTDGNLFVAIDANNAIEKVDPSGHVSLYAHGSGVSNPVGVTFDSSGNLYESNFYNQTLGKFDTSGNFTIFANLGLTTPRYIIAVPEPPAQDYSVFVREVRISTNSSGGLVYQPFGNGDFIRECAEGQGITNLAGLSLVYNRTADALQVVVGTNHALVCTPLRFVGGTWLHNSNYTRAERLAFVDVETNTVPGGTLAATERFVYGPSNIVNFSLSGQLQYTVPDGTNGPAIYKGSISATSGFQGFEPEGEVNAFRPLRTGRSRDQ